MRTTYWRSLETRRWTTGLLAILIAVTAVAVRAKRSTTKEGVMQIGQNKALARRWREELWGRGNLGVADEIIADDYLRHDPGDPFPARGPADVKRIVTMLRSMLPDLTIHIEAMVAEVYLVVRLYTATANVTVGYMGLPPTGKVIRTEAMQMFRFANGKIVESWAVRDDLGTLRQLGHLPQMGGPR